MSKPAEVVLSLALPPAKLGMEPFVPLLATTFLLSTPVGMLTSSKLKTRAGSRSAAARAGSPNSLCSVNCCHRLMSSELSTALPLRLIASKRSV